MRREEARRQVRYWSLERLLEHSANTSYNLTNLDREVILELTRRVYEFLHGPQAPPMARPA